MVICYSYTMAKKGAIYQYLFMSNINCMYIKSTITLPKPVDKILFKVQYSKHIFKNVLYRNDHNIH